MTQAPFSVLMSLYGRESPENLRTSLRSLQNQTTQPTQIVLVIDGPISIELEDVIIQFTKVLPMKIVRLAKNVGLAKALNEGLAYCTETWIARFDTDDICEPERLQAQWSFLNENSEIDILGTAIREFGISPEAPYAIRAVPKDHEKIIRVARRKNPFNHVTVVFRKDLVISIGGYPDDHLYEDYALWVRLIQNGAKCANLDHPLVRVRAGRDMSNRRGGWNYFCSEWRVQQRFRRQGFLSWPRFILNIATRAPVRLSPQFIRGLIYRYLIRQRVPQTLSSTR